MKKCAQNVCLLRSLLAGLVFCCFLAMTLSVAVGQTDDDGILVTFGERIYAPGIYFGEDENDEDVTLFAQSVAPGSSVTVLTGVYQYPGGTLVPVSGILTYTPRAGSVVVMFRADGLKSKLKVPDSNSDSAGGYSLQGTNSDGEPVNDSLTIGDSENGKVTSFSVDEQTYNWEPESRQYHGQFSGGSTVNYAKYTFYSNGDGSYGYTVTIPSVWGGDSVIESGTATPN